MVSFKKSTIIILALSLFLSLIPNFLYTGERGVSADEEENPCEGLGLVCPENCSGPEYDKKSGVCVCYNCPTFCETEIGNFTNKSCLPLKGTGDWTCGVEIPVGEVMDNTTERAIDIQLNFEGIIENGKEMILWGDRLLTDYKEWDCQGYTDWEEKEKKCETDCRKYYSITAGELQPGQPNEEQCEEKLGKEISKGKSIYPEKCNEDYTQCIPCNEYCGQEEHKEECCWYESFKINVPDPEHPEKTIEKEISCKYCKKEDEGENKYCYEHCSVDSCKGCCGQYFNPIIMSYETIKTFQETLKNNIEETNTPEKLKRAYLLEQLDFARCQLALCWTPAEEYTESLVGNHLLTCEQANQLGLLGEDQVACFSFRAAEDLKEIEKLTEELKTASFWKKPIVYIQLQWKVIKFSLENLWTIITGGNELTQEEGCYPGNYYCCRL